MLDSNVDRLVSRARALPELPTCADCSARLGAGSQPHRDLCSLCYANRLVHGGQILVVD